MAKPTKHRNKWRIRWVDYAGRRQSEVYERYQDAECTSAKTAAVSHGRVTNVNVVLNEFNNYVSQIRTSWCCGRRPRVFHVAEKMLVGVASNTRR
jgi:hypothetical protein